MNSTLDLFGEPEVSSAPDAIGGMPGMPSSMAVTSTGLPPEWGLYALDIVFANRKAYAKARLTPASRAELIRSLWDYALARHDSSMARRSASTAASSLSGHRKLDDKLDRALRVIESHLIEVRDIPPARDFGPQFDLRHLVGSSPFPLNDTAGA